VLLRDKVDLLLSRGRVDRCVKGDVLSVKQGRQGRRVQCATEDRCSLTDGGLEWGHGGMGDEQTSRSCCERSGRWRTTRRRVAGT
jgi:hypothetical protein